MKDLDEIRGRCRMEDGHWIWTGATRTGDGRPSIWAPDHTNGGMRSQPGARAVWHMSAGKPIPNGWRVFGCDELLCVNPAHGKCMPQKRWGELQGKAGRWKGKTNRILANRAIGRARSRMTPELIAEIQASEETGRALAQRLQIGTSLVSKARRGEYVVYQGANPFGGLTL